MNQGLRLDRLAKDTLLNLLRQGLNIALGIATSVVLARGLGVEDRGLYALATLLPTLVFTFTNFGLSSSTAYYVARGKYEMDRAFNSGSVLAFWIGIISLMIGTLVIILFHDALFKDVPLMLLFISLAAVPATLLANSLQSIFQGSQDFKSYNALGIFPQIFMLVMFFILIWMFDMGVIGAVWTYLTGAWFSAILLVSIFIYRSAHTKRKTNTKFTLSIDREYAVDIFSYGIKSHLANIVAFLNYRGDTFLVNFLAGASAVGVYGISVGMAERLWILSGAISTVLFPRIASLESEGNKRDILTPLIARHVLLLTILMAVGVGVLSNWLIVMLYGREFIGSVAALRWLMPGVIAVSMSRVLANDIAGRGFPQINLKQSLVAFAINMTANIILIPKFAASGAAIASTISYTILAFMKTAAYSKLTGTHWRVIWFPIAEDIEGWKTLLALARKKIIGKEAAE